MVLSVSFRNASVVDLFIGNVSNVSNDTSVDVGEVVEGWLLLLVEHVDGGLACSEKRGKQMGSFCYFWLAGLCWWCDEKKGGGGGVGKAGRVHCTPLWPASVSRALYRGVTPPARLVVSQQQHEQPSLPPAQSAHRAAGGRDMGSRDSPRLCRPLLPCTETQGAQTQVMLPNVDMALKTNKTENSTKDALKKTENYAVGVATQ